MKYQPTLFSTIMATTKHAKKKKAAGSQPAVEISADYSGLAPDADSAMYGAEFVEMYSFRENGGGGAEHHTHNQDHVVWRSRLPFIILFENNNWGNYLQLATPAQAFLFWAGANPAGISAQLDTATQKYVVKLSVINPGATGPKVYLGYRFIPVLQPAGTATRRARGPRPYGSTGSAGARATIVLQD